MDDDEIKILLPPFTVTLQESDPRAIKLPKTFEIRGVLFDKDRNTDLF